MKEWLAVLIVGMTIGMVLADLAISLRDDYALQDLCEECHIGESSFCHSDSGVYLGCCIRPSFLRPHIVRQNESCEEIQLIWR